MTQTNQGTIVVGIDYSETSRLALKRALGIDGVVHVVHVVEPPAWIAPSPMLGQVAPIPISIEDSMAVLRRFVDEQVAAFGTESGRGAKRVVSHLAIGGAADEIVQIASDLDADLIVVGTHGRRGVQRLLIGSIAERVIRTATCPVLVERPKANLADPVPRIEPPCPRCVETRRSSNGSELWCEQHRERHGRRHTYHSTDRSAAFPSAHGGLGSVS